MGGSPSSLDRRWLRPPVAGIRAQLRALDPIQRMNIFVYPTLFENDNKYLGEILMYLYI